MGFSKTPCQIKRDLLVDYLSTLEQLKVAQWQHKEILTIGIGDGLALRSAQRIEAKSGDRFFARSSWRPSDAPACESLEQYCTYPRFTLEGE